MQINDLCTRTVTNASITPSSMIRACSTRADHFHKGGNLHRTAVDGKTPGNGYIPITNYIWRKYIQNNVELTFGNNPTDYHYVIFRYGRALLNKGRSLARTGPIRCSKVSSGSHIQPGLRTTHGNLFSIATSLADAWHDYKIERHVDLVLKAIITGVCYAGACTAA